MTTTHESSLNETLLLAREGPDTCAICCGGYSEQDNITILPCHQRHYFHRQCIDEWLSRVDACPLCKKELSYL